MSNESPRPILLPQNRKVRHLRGVFIRNVSFSRPRGRTIDDAGIKTTSLGGSGGLTTTALSADGGQLHHALSSESLRPPGVRRRSTNLAGASPATRQKRLEDAVESRVADVFFSLHVEGAEDPVYVSELGTRATNFNFAFFELADLDPSISRSPQVTVKVWTRRQETWSLLIEEEVDLRALNWLGTLHNAQFPPNALVFHLVDGVYSLDLSKKYPPPKQMAPLQTSSYNALMKLATLDNSIQDALATRDALAKQINEILEKTADNKAPEAEDKLALAERYVASQKRAVSAAKKRKEELLASIASRRKAIEIGCALQEKATVDVENAQEKLKMSKELAATTKESIHGQRRRICEDLAQIYQITPVPMGPPLSFQICGIPLPNTTYDSTLTSKTAGEDALSAALGHVARLTDALQYYLSVPLPYEITPFGSRSSIRDDISKLSVTNDATQREFPLYVPRGGSSAQFRFDYGWFLLNKDIEALCVSQGLKVVDIRHTLPNLKYLLYVCSAGTDEVPERKRGGVRGLWAGRMKSFGVGDGDTSSLGGSSRRGSADSDALGKQREELRLAMIKENGKGTGKGNGNGAVASDGGGKEAGQTVPVLERPGLDLPFDEGGTKLTLRTKGFRENAVR